MSNKEIKIRWISDDSAIDQSVQRLQQKLKQMNQSSAQIQNIQETGGTLSKRAEYAQKAFQKSSVDILQRESRELEQKQRKESLGLLEKQRELRKIEIAEGAITKEKQRQMDLLKEEINLRSQKIMDLEATKQKIDQQIKSTTGGDGGATGGAGGGAGQAASGGFMSFLRKLGGAALLSGGLNAAAAIGGDINTRRAALTRAEGGAAFGASRDMREVYGGRGSDRFFFANERAQAANIIRDEYEDKRKLSVLGAGGRAVGGGVVGGVTGAGIGSAIGGTIGGIGALGIGAMTGGIGLATGGAMIAGGAKLGGWLGAGAGALLGGSMAMGREGRTAIFDPERFNKEQLAQAMKDREGLEMALMMKDPRKMLGREQFNKNVDRYSAFQRQIGLGDEEAFGERGFVQTQMNQGKEFGGTLFQEADVMAAYQGLRGSSGLTQSRELTGRAAALQRQFGIENAPEQLGRMMGQSGMGVGETEDAFKKIMAEAVSMGVDATKMSAEMQNFTTIASELATQGGGYSKLVAQQLAGAGGDFSAARLGAARSEFAEFEQRAGAGAGLEGQLGWGFLMGDKGEKAFGKDLMGKIRQNPEMMNVLNQMSASQLEKSGQLQGFAEMLAGEGATEEDIKGISDRLLSGTREKDISKQSRTQRGEDLLRKYKEGVERAGGEKAFMATREGRAISSQLFLERGASYGSDFIQQGMQRTMAEFSMGSGITSKAGAGDLSKIEEAMRASTGRAAEEEKGSRAVGEMLRINEMAKLSEDFIKAAKKNNEGAEIVGAQFDKLAKTIEKKNGDLEAVLTTLEKQMESLTDKMAESGMVVVKPTK